MNSSGPLKVLGAISAMETFVENFPMSILDLMHGPTYTSVFVFLIDILRECNVPIMDIANRVIERVFGIETKFQGGVNTIYQKIMDMEIDEQSQFLKTLEDGVKIILMALLTSIFSCSAQPFLPTRYMDTSRVHFNGSNIADMKFPSYRTYINSLTTNKEILVPLSTLNSFGHLDINPFSNAGKLYFSVDGGDKYYKKVEKNISDVSSNTISIPDCDTIAKLFFDFGEGHADFLSDLNAQDELVLRINAPIEQDVSVQINYKDFDGIEQDTTLTIHAGQRCSEIFFLTAQDKSEQKEIVNSIKIVGGGNGKRITLSDETIYIYLSKSDSQSVINFWKASDNDSLDTVNWGDISNCQQKTISIDSSEAKNSHVYEYVVSDTPVQDAIRMNYVPTEPNEESPEYIVCYSGLDPNTLYRTEDMNAFIWYVVNRGMDIPQIELNKMMWDNRRPAKSFGVERLTDEQWNNWYNSKPTPNDELVYNEGPVEGELVPIIQLRKSGEAIAIKFPSQTYFKPRSTAVDNDGTYKHLRMNSTIYKFNYDYLNSIKIFNPKVLMFDMFDALLNGALSLFLSINVSLTRNELEAMLSNAIKKYIEADDMEIEDCYFTFSNDEYDKLLQDMLLSKYGATYTGGEVNKATQHNLEEYLAKMDSVNFSSSAAGETTKITKLITEVSVTAGNEGSIEYGITGGIDEGWWKKLLWAIALPLIKCIFTPQILMLFMINFQIMGITSFEDLWGNNQAMVIRLIINKIFGLVKSILLFVRDKLAEILLEYFIEVILPVLAKYQLLKLREKLEAWITLLASAIACLPRFDFSSQRPIGQIDEVDYADIINEQTTPESAGGC